MNAQPRTLDDLGIETTWLESIGSRFDRWSTGPESSVCVCSDCGAVVDDIDDGCRSCGIEEDPTWV